MTQIRSSFFLHMAAWRYNMINKMGEIKTMIIWLIVMIPCSLLFCGLGIYAWKRKDPMWFYSGTEVKREEIRDIPAYNRANGIMWLCLGAFLCLCTVLGVMHSKAGGFLLIGGMIAALPLLPMTFTWIYNKYKA